MGRWEPGAPDRLQRAAMELFEERGYERTTVADIAERAGLSERTFFRHFADKREVLFGGGRAFLDLLVAGVEGAPSDVFPYEAVLAGLLGAGAALEQLRGRDLARRRQRVVAQSVELTERELAKLAEWTDAVAAVLRSRGAGSADAQLAAASGIAVFRTSFERWVDDPEAPSLPECIAESSRALRALLGSVRPSPEVVARGSAG